MIPEPFLEIIILIVLIWVFENKVLPQVIFMFLSLVLLLGSINNTDYRYTLFFAATMMYSALQIQKEDDK